MGLFRDAHLLIVFFQCCCIFLFLILPKLHLDVFAADHSAFHATVATFLAPSLLALALLAVFLLFKIDLLLAHRRLRTRFSKNKGALATLENFT